MVTMDIADEVRAMSKKHFICFECDIWIERTDMAKDEKERNTGYCLGCYEALKNYCSLCKRHIEGIETREQLVEHITKDLEIKTGRELRG